MNVALTLICKAREEFNFYHINSIPGLWEQLNAHR